MSVHKILDSRCSHQLMARPTSQVFSDHEAGGLLTNHSLIQGVIGCHSLGSFENSEGESRRLIFAGNVIAVRPGASEHLFCQLELLCCLARIRLSLC